MNKNTSFVETGYNFNLEIKGNFEEEEMQGKSRPEENVHF